MQRTILVYIALLAIVLTGTSFASNLHHALAISVFPQDKSLLATDSLFLPADLIDGDEVRLLLNRSLHIDRVRSNAPVSNWYTQEDLDPETFVSEPDSEDIELIRRAKGIFIQFDRDSLPQALIITITYSGVIYDSLKAPPRAYAKGFGNTTGLIDERGVYLTNESLWYPLAFDQCFTFDMVVDVPKDWMAVTQGGRRYERVEVIDDEERVVARWIEPNPGPELYLVAGRYYRYETNHNSTLIMVYLYQPADSLATTYIDATKNYLGMYENLIGGYPYDKFALVENFWQTGFGMPSFTLLGSKVIRLPFIVRTSYGHEILHNWWGNSVYVDYDNGNWCEGLTTYLADYLYKEKMGESQARDYRHHTLIAFRNSVTPEKDFPLREFRERHDAASQSVGYGKSLMVFHMLRNCLGDSLFWEVLRHFYGTYTFRIASWGDIEASIRAVTGQNFSWYFDQWVNRTGAPSLRLSSPRWQLDGDAYRVVFTLTQDEPPYVLDVPVRIKTTQGYEQRVFRLADRESTYVVGLGSQPLLLEVDPDYDLFRNLYPEEVPITLGALFGQDSTVAIVGNGEDSSSRTKLHSVAVSWGLEGRVFLEDDVDSEGLLNKPIWLMGFGSLMDTLLSHLDQVKIDHQQITIDSTSFDLKDNTVVLAIADPSNRQHAIGVILSKDIESLTPLAPRLPHYSRYSYVVFTKTEAILKGIWQVGSSPLTFEFNKR